MVLAAGKTLYPSKMNGHGASIDSFGIWLNWGVTAPDKPLMGPAPQGRWTSGPSLDGPGKYSVQKLRPMGEKPSLAPPIPQAFAQKEELTGGKQRVQALNGHR